MPDNLQFPKNFLWGAAASAHQVEGGNHNDWSEWELANAERLAAEAEKRFGRLPSWPMIREQTTRPENYISGRACDHYRRFREDFDIARSLGHTSHRFSIEWSRIEPEEGRFDEHEIEHYREVIMALRERGMEPFVTLWHWTLPVWLRDKGGVESKEFPKYFARYVQNIVSSLGTSVRFWITLNEPDIQPMNAYFRGLWPPQRTGILAYSQAVHQLIRAHKAAYQVIKTISPNAQIGVSKDNVYFESANWNPWNILLRMFADYFWNHYFFNAISGHQDFVGLNYYFHNRIDWWYQRNENRKISDLGWELYPAGFYFVLKDLARYKKPIYVTENGLADMQDEKRAQFIKDCIASMKRAIGEGVDVRGYFYWSLLDNFEWDKGFWPRFGLMEIDYKTLERKIRPSAREFKRIIDELSL
ncbi:MAG: glycoside hydrolase family 1 protein [Candidatus Sungbacteria bacterium]|nr:glycoside hydrolase family 1 protein [Candidatus Sungbacteria bacterium]